MFHKEGKLFIFVLAGSTEAGKFSVNGINGSTAEGAVGNDGVAEGSLVVLIVEEFLGEELLEFERSPRFARWVVGFPLVASFVHMG